MIPVVLSGGVGSRLWPLSRGMYPKQLLNLVDSQLSMLQQTVLRSGALDSVQAPIVVCNEDHRFMVGEQLQEIGADQATIILEPEGRNTAPAIALAAFTALRDDPDATLLVMPADHVIPDQEAFGGAVNDALIAAQDGALVTFGIVPQGPETAYGYIKAHVSGDEDAYPVSEFKEKPSADVARRYLAAGDYFWNGGIFVFRADCYLQELQRFEPEIYAATEEAIQSATPDLDFLRADSTAFARSPSISIDYAVMEKTDKARMIPLNAGWNDVGSWSALWDISDKDEQGNSLRGDVLVHDASNSHIYSETKLVAAVGVENLVIVETDDAVLVAARESAQDVKAIVSELQAQDRTQTEHHRKVYRPWGWYDSVDSGDQFQVKRIQVKPGARLSVQKHRHRAEHWVVVKGTAEVRNGDRVMKLHENESTYIPIGSIHSLHNPSSSDPLEIIEVQTGSYLGEDDIERFEDQYGRTVQ